MINNNNEKYISFKLILFYTYFLTAPFAVSSLFRNMMPLLHTNVFIMVVTCVFLFFYFIRVKQITVYTLEKESILLLIIPVFLSVIGIVYAFIFKQNPNFISITASGFIRRLLLIIVNVSIFLGLLSVTHFWTRNQIIKLIKKYYYGLLIFMLIGIWQFLSFYIGLPFLDIETRSHIHSVSGSDFLIENRITSLANEPSFLAPLLIDLIIISFLVSKRPIPIAIFSFAVLIFSYSGGGYLNISIVLIFSLFALMRFKGLKIKSKHIFVIGVLVSFFSIIIIVNSQEIIKALYPVLGRIDSIFDIESHSRMFMITMSFIWVTENGLINTLFGFGPNSYTYLHFTKFLPSGSQVHITSNNLFSDIVYELGYIGLFSYLTMFLRLCITSVKKMYSNKYYLQSFILTIHLMASSIYRADFMQPRFWIVLFIIMILIRMGNGKYKV